MNFWSVISITLGVICISTSLRRPFACSTQTYSMTVRSPLVIQSKYNTPPESDEILLTPRSIRFKNKKKKVRFNPHSTMKFILHLHDTCCVFQYRRLDFTLVGWIAVSTRSILYLVHSIVTWVMSWKFYEASTKAFVINFFRTPDWLI